MNKVFQEEPTGNVLDFGGAPRPAGELKDARDNEQKAKHADSAQAGDDARPPGKLKDDRNYKQIGNIAEHIP